MESRERQAILYAATAHGLVHVVEITYSVLLLRIGVEFGIGVAALGLIANAMRLALGSGAIPAGFVADRLGSRRMLVITMVAASGCSLLVALSTNVAMLAVTLTALGAAIGLYHPSGLSLISRNVEKRGLAMGYHGMAGNMGVALTPLFASGVASFWGWRGPYFVLAVVTLAVAAVILLAPFRERAGRPEGAGQATGAAPVAGGAERWHELLGPLLLLYMATMLGGFIYSGSLTFLPAHFQEHVHLRIGRWEGPVLAGSLTTVALFFGVAGQFIGGNLAQRYRLERLALLLSLLLAPSLLLVGLTSDAALVAAAAGFALFNFMAQPAWNSLVAEYTPAHLQGRSYGINFFATFGLGAFAAGFSGVVAQRLGVQWVFVVMAGLAVLVSVLALWLLARASGRRRTAAQAAGAGGAAT